jgi:acyl-CoA thioesterase I
MALAVSGLLCVVLGLAAVTAVLSAGSDGAGEREEMPLSQSSERGSQQGLADDAETSALLRGERPLTWVFVGDSITHGVDTEGWRSFVEHFAERVRTELGRVDDVVINTGISGNRTEDVLAGFDMRVSRFGPDVVVVMLGTNDSVEGPGGRAGYQQELGRIVARVRDIGAVPVLQVPPPVDTSAADERDDLGAYAEAVREVADARRVVLVDHRAHWLRVGNGQAPPRWLADEIHPNGRGHLEMARTLFRRLGIFDAGSPTGGAHWAEEPRAPVDRPADHAVHRPLDRAVDRHGYRHG